MWTALPDFDAFVRSAWPTLRQAAFAPTGNRVDAEDLLLTVLTRTYARCRSDPVAYVRRALINAHVDTWRRRSRLREDATEHPPDTLGYDAGAESAEDRADVRRLLDALSPRERTIVVRRHYLGLSEQDVAHALGCSVGTVKSTSSRALQRLRVHTAHLQSTRMNTDLTDLGTRFRVGVDSLETGLPAQPDLAVVHARGRRIRRRHTALLSVAAAATVAAVIAVPVALTGGDRVSPPVVIPTSTPPGRPGRHGMAPPAWGGDGQPLRGLEHDGRRLSGDRPRPGRRSLRP